MMTGEVKLTRSQHLAAQCLLRRLPAADVLVLEGPAGSGKTVVLREVQRQSGGKLIGARQFLEALIAPGPAAIEEAFLGMLDEALASHDLVLVDDLHLAANIVQSCDHPRTHLLDAALTAVLGEASAQGKKIVFATVGEAPWPIARRAFKCSIAGFTAEDYRGVGEAYLAPAVSRRFEYARLHALPRRCKNY